MRPACLFCLLFALIGISAAQDTNFPTGPQYLLTGSPLFARPVATPSLSLDAPLPPIPDLPDVGPRVVNQPYIPNPELQNQPDLLPIYYGYPMPSPVELLPTDSPKELPQNVVDIVDFVITDVRLLRERGYGMTLGEISSYWKSHEPHATRVFTNADVERLHVN